MVAPITDMAPGILGIADLPIHAIASDAVRVVTVGRRGVEKHTDHLLEPGGITLREALPVLEDIAPVALVGVKRAALFVLDVDIESIPGPARIAMAATETQRQILMGQPWQV